MNGHEQSAFGAEQDALQHEDTLARWVVFMSRYLFWAAVCTFSVGMVLLN